MAGKSKTYSLIHIFILFAIGFPAIVAFQKYSQREKIDGVEDTEYNKPNLTGLVISNEIPQFNIKDWVSGSFQKISDDYNNDRWAFKEIMVRLNNQLYYDAFNQIRVNQFVSGKDNYVFSESYIYSAFGDDLMKEEKVKSLMEKAKVLQDTLKKKGIDLFLVFAPGKGEFCKELIEDKYKHPVVKTNHDLFTQFSKPLALNVLDLYDLFNQLKPSAPYPLFTKFGHHWSFYAECFVVDTLISYVENLHHCDLPNILWNKIEVSDTARSRDADILKSMNLISNPEQNMKLAYPDLQFENDTSKNKTKMLTISDSYWYGPVYMSVPQFCFAKGSFWYYCNKVVPSPKPGEKVEVWQLDFKREIESNQVIMLLYSDGNLPNFGNNFIPDAYEMYTSPKTYYERLERHKQIQTYAKQIRDVPSLLKLATQKSNDMMIPLDSAIKLDARRMAGVN